MKRLPLLLIQLSYHLHPHSNLLMSIHMQAALTSCLHLDCSQQVQPQHTDRL